MPWSFKLLFCMERTGLETSTEVLNLHSTPFSSPSEHGIFTDEPTATNRSIEGGEEEKRQAWTDPTRCVCVYVGVYVCVEVSVHERVRDGFLNK